MQAESLLAEGADANAVDKNGRRAVHFAAFKGELAVLQLLGSKGADLDAEDADVASAVQYAALANREQCLMFLADRGCWLDSFDRHDNTALHLAARHGASDTAQRLLRLGAKRHLANQRKLTPLGLSLIHI